MSPETAPEQAIAPEVSERDRKLEDLQSRVIERYKFIIETRNRVAEATGGHQMSPDLFVKDWFNEEMKKIDENHPSDNQELQSNITSGKDDHGMGGEDYLKPTA